MAEGDLIRHTIASRAPEYRVADTVWARNGAAYRPAGPGRTYWRFGNLHVSILDPTAVERIQEERERARLGAARRQPYDVLAFLWWKRGVSAMTCSRNRCSRTEGRSAAQSAATKFCRTRPIGLGRSRQEIYATQLATSAVNFFQNDAIARPPPTALQSHLRRSSTSRRRSRKPGKMSAFLISFQMVQRKKCNKYNG